jgi:serine/threonine protein kinase
MSPEVVLHCHISKASDVYAFGILLFELVTGQRAFAGTPTPLLAHAVAVGGLRPAWPSGVAPELQPLVRLAEACWAQEPASR